MRMPDVNVLIYAFRADDPAHEFYREWIEEQINGGVPFALSLLVAVTFVRIVTNPRLSAGPTSLPHAIHPINLLLAQPNVRELLPGPDHWRLVKMLCEKTGATGRQVADAQHAAIAMEHGCTWVTRDEHFRSFAPHGLRLEILDPA